MTETENTLDLGELYPHLKKTGLLQFAESQDDRLLFEISPCLFTNGLIIELHKLSPSYPTLAKWIRLIQPDSCPHTIVPQKLAQNLKKVTDQRKKLLKSKSKKNSQKIHDLLHTQFTMPQNPKTKQSNDEIATTSSLSIATPPISTATSPISTATPPISTATPPISTATPPISTATPSISTVTSPISTATPPISTVTPSISNVTPSTVTFQRLTDIHQTTLFDLKKMKSENTKLKKQYNNHSQKFAHIKQKYLALQKEKRRNVRKNNSLRKLTHTNHKIFTKCKSTQISQIKDCSNCSKLKLDIDKLTEELENTENTIKTLPLKQGKSYTSETIKCVLTLLSHGVGYDSVGPVMESVLELANAVPNSVPKRSTVGEMAKLRTPINQIHLAETIYDESTTTLYSDETSKFGQVYESYAITTTDYQEKVLGIRPMANKSSVATLETLKNIITDLDSLDHKSDAGKRVLTSIKNTMSDRAQTQKCFNNLLQEYRTSVLAELIPNWNVLHPDEQSSHSTIFNFFCGLHLLVNAADLSNSSLLNYEKELKADHFRHDSNIIQLIYMSCKAFSRGGDEKSGCFESFHLYLKDKGVTNHLTNFKGNRFNILFHNAAEVFALRHDILHFLTDVHGTTNKLLSEIKSSITDTIHIAGCRALGLIDKFITGPLWRLLEKKEPILTMNSKYEILIGSLKTIDIPKFMSGEVLLFPEETPQASKDSVLQELINDDSSDPETQHILEHLLPDLVSLFEKLLKDQLPGGIHHGKTIETHPECSSTLKHNKIPERLFGQLDWLQHAKPSQSIYTAESHIMFNFNNTQKWISEMSSTEWDHKCKKAKFHKTLSFQQFKTRLSDLKAQKMLALKKKEEEIKARRERMAKRNENAVVQMIEHGLWQSAEEVDLKVSKNYNFKNSKIEAIKAQLRFRKNVLKQTPSDSSLYAFTVKKKKLTLQQLSQNLKKLISEAKDSDAQLGTTTSDVLVGRSCTHYFWNDDILTPYDGIVISQVPGYRSWYNIVYDDEPDNVYTYKLMEDYASGDLILK